MDLNSIWGRFIVYSASAGLVVALVALVGIWLHNLNFDLIGRAKRGGVWATLFWCMFTLVMARCGTVTHADKAAYFGGSATSETQSGPQTHRRSVRRGFVTAGIPEVRDITADDYAAGVVLAQVVLDETHDFTAPVDAVVFDDWCRFGAECDWFRLEFAEEWRLPFADTNLSAVTVYSQGFIRPAARSMGNTISPLGTGLGFAPSAVELHDGGGLIRSRFWYRHSEVGSMILTWENALLDRDALVPISFQVELFDNGDMVFRYDMSRVESATLSGVCVGVTREGVGRMMAELSTRVTTLKWSRLDPSWADVADPDGDGASTSDEVFVLGTDPANADSDGDGILDGSDPYPTEPDADGDGIADGISLENYLSHPLWGGQDGYGTGVDIFLNSPVVPPAKAVLRVGSLPIVLTTNAVYRIKIEDGVRYDIRLTTNRMAPVNLSLGRDGE